MTDRNYYQCVLHYEFESLRNRIDTFKCDFLFDFPEIDINNYN